MKIKEVQGKYDQDCESILRSYGASLVVVMVIGGKKGNGFSVSTNKENLIARVPEILRNVANGIDKQLADKPDQR